MSATTAPKAIETRYKGYRFRSRLEARWAVFFDHLGVKWEYEAQGFDLGPGLGPYLPDFWLPDERRWVEVKPEADRLEEQRLYLAGKITDDHWRDEIVGERVHTAANLVTDGFDKLAFRIADTPHLYVGPFKVELDRHGGSPTTGSYPAVEELHGLEACNTGAKGHDYPNTEVIFRNCMEAIESATVVFAWVGAADCYATFAEIGYALRARKLVRVGFDKRLGYSVINDMWFLRDCASASGQYDTAAQSFADLVGGCESWMPLECRKAAKLSRQSGRPCEIVYGDPLAHYCHRTTPSLYAADGQWHDAMVAARSARFEHGETPGVRA